ncbi:MAG: hypothetical protein IIU80_07015 [Clostridia bacterium]|nr:hypothetical protein [Clostridia bacterium]
MKKYMKPVFNIAAAVPNPHPGNSCTTSQEDMTLIAQILGMTWEELSVSKAFALSEGCETVVPLDMYCKFTSVSATGSAGVKAFLS